MNTTTSSSVRKVSIPVDNELAIAITIECLRSTYLDAKSLRPGFVDPKDLKAFRRVLRWFGEAASDLESRNNNDRGKQNAS